MALVGHAATCTGGTNTAQSSASTTATIQITPRLYNNNNNTNNNNSSSPLTSPTDATSSAKKKTKANRPPPKLILISTDTTEYRRLEGSDHIIILKQQAKEPSQPPTVDPLSESRAVGSGEGAAAPRKPISIAPKPMESLLSEEAKKILHSSSPRYEMLV